MNARTPPASRRKIVIESRTNSCFFRSAAAEGERKALVQVTERCNLHCAHCFVSSTLVGRDVSLDLFETRVLPRLRAARVTRLTLTGGEPFAHPNLLQMVTSARGDGLDVGICTNATLITDEQIEQLRAIGGVHINVSFDGFRAESHGRFRGNPGSFSVTVETTRRLAKAGLLQGLLSTPNALTTAEDYRLLAEFAVATEAEYLLMNPLSSMGRGVKSKGRLAATEVSMNRILHAVDDAADGAVEIVPIRFLNEDQPLSGCIAGDIIYVFADGEVAVCPYLVFAARTPGSLHTDREFLVGNIFEQEIVASLDAFHFHERYEVGANPTCESCELSADCGKGCPAAVIASGGRIGERDVEVCPLP